MRLVYAHYLVELADRGQVLVRRQDMPEDAFVPLERLQSIRGEGVGGMLRVLVVSYPWLQVCVSYLHATRTHLIPRASALPPQLRWVGEDAFVVNASVAHAVAARPS